MQTEVKNKTMKNSKDMNKMMKCCRMKMQRCCRI